MEYFELLLLGLLVICGVSTCVTKNLMASLVIFMAYSVLMSILWALLKAPDLAVTEAAVGAGVTSLLFFLALKKIHAIDARNEVRREHAAKRSGGDNNGEE